ncbi:zinc finger protein 76 isoform X2 [Aplysia californica]|uniref:Zinc finger protein 76 isoform X2 n=1 Tax=Aplysia californica TaxID=6500 RepID=A0ABM0K1P0_APLCA|nr:zinc finger protein 76 isoform X2 [Aplysia californica]
MDNVLEGLAEPSSLSPLSTTVHDEDFTTLGEHTEGTIEGDHLNSDGEEALTAAHDVDDDHVTIVPGEIGEVDDDPIGLGVAGGPPSEVLHHVGGLEGVVADTVDSGQSQGLEEVNTQVALDDPNVLTSETHLVQAAEQEGILLTTDADGNLAVPVSADHVIRLFMQTSDGNVVAADAPMEALKFSMPGLMTTSEGGETTQTVQAVTLPDGTTTLIEAPKDPETVPESQLLPKFVEGQTIKLENGTTALLQPTPREALNEGLQAIQLEDGSTAFISHPNPEGLFAAGSSQIDASSLNLDQLASQTMIGAADKSSDKALVIGDKAYKCLYEDCGRLYTTHHHLKVHERSHTGDRPFICDFPNCGKAFATGYGLKSHNRVHTGEKPYPCPESGCEKAFKTSGDLQKHVRTHTGERPFKCPFEGCTRSFTTSNIRKVHIRTHTGERPYICDMEGCGRAFASATNYKNHIRIHTGEKPYVCTVQDCGKRFTEYSSLYKHHVVHTHTKPYTCSHCGKTYRQTSTLAMHKRTAHGEDYPQELAGDGAEMAICVTNPESAEPPTKKRMIKSELPQSGETSAGENLIVNSTDGSQMVLLASQMNSSEAVVTLADGTAQLANLVALQSPGTISMQELQQSGVAGFTSLSLGEAGQQVLVVTDPSQLEALQQLAAQHLETLTHVPDGTSVEAASGDDGAGPEGGGNVSIPTEAIAVTTTSLSQ